VSDDKRELRSVGQRPVDTQADTYFDLPTQAMRIDHSSPDRVRTRELFERFAELPQTHPERARIRSYLVELHLPLVEYIARRFRNQGEWLDDLTQVATIGLIKSIDRFDLERGVEFSTYATPIIVGEIKRHLRDRGWAVRVPRRLQELKLSLTKAIGDLAQREGRAPTVSELAAHLQMSKEEVLEGLESANAYLTVSLDAGDSGGEDSPGMVDDALEGVEYRESLKPLLEQLPPREKKILLLRFFGDMTPSQIAAELGISKKRVSSLLDRTLAQLRKGLSEESAERVERESTDRAESSLYPDDSLGVALIDNQLRLITVQADGKVKFLDPRNNSHHLLYLASLVTYGWKSLIKELEDLINTPQVNESQLQGFFESNPEFLCGDTYESAKPHIVLQRPDAGPLIPDFALKPPNEHALCDLLELKLPSAKLLVGQSNRKRLSAALLEACAQLREYRDYFESSANRQAVEEIYGLRFFRPRMMVIIGKRSEYIADDLRKAEGDITGLSITTYDDLLERARSRMRRIEKPKRR
jgi:RNA polymerase sigma-B factor